jgi:hypothetical protein
MRWQRAAAWLLAWLFLVPAVGAWAQDETGEAALVVVLEDGRVETRCVSLAEGPLTGAELLQHTDLEVIFEVSALGQKVCQVEGVGCPYPQTACFCQCMSSDCTYWNYYYREPGDAAWTYSPLGSGARQIQPGGMEGWVWGDGRTPPPELAFEAVCPPPATAEPATEVAPTAPPSTPRPSVTAVASATRAAQATPTPVATDRTSPSDAGSPLPSSATPAITPSLEPDGASQPDRAWLPYAAFGGIGLALVIWLVVARRRQ